MRKLRLHFILKVLLATLAIQPLIITSSWALPTLLNGCSSFTVSEESLRIFRESSSPFIQQNTEIDRLLFAEVSEKILLLENIIFYSNTNELSDCFIYTSIELSQLIYSNLINYRPWLEIIYQRIPSPDQNDNFEHIYQSWFEFSKIFERYWFNNMQAFIEQVSFDEKWEETKSNLKLVTAFLGGSGAFFKAPRSIILKLLRTPQYRIAILGRATPLTATSAFKDRDNKVNDYLTNLSADELPKLLESPIAILSNSSPSPYKMKIKSQETPLENINYKQNYQNLFTKIISLGGGISVGLFADYLLMRFKIVSYLESKSKTFDDLVDEKTKKIKPAKIKNKMSYSDRKKQWIDWAKNASEKIPEVIEQKKHQSQQIITKNLNIEGALKASKKAVQMVKSLWFNLTVSFAVSIITTHQLRKFIEKHFLQLNQDEFSLLLKEKMEAITEASSLIKKHDKLSLLYNFLMQHSNYLNRKTTSKRIFMAHDLLQKMGPTIFCHKYYGSEFSFVVNGKPQLSEKAYYYISEEFEKNKPKYKESIQNSLSDLESKIKEFIFTYENTISPFITELNLFTSHYLKVEFETHIHLLKDLLNVETQLGLIRSNTMDYIALEALSSFSPADETSVINNFKKNEFITNSDPQVFCQGKY